MRAVRAGSQTAVGAGKDAGATSILMESGTDSARLPAIAILIRGKMTEAALELASDRPVAMFSR